MRSWGRVPANAFQSPIGFFIIGVSPIGESLAWKWVEVDTDADGNNDLVMATTLVQNLKLNLGESPFFGNYGIPAHPSVVQQIAPDYYVALTQQRFAAFFASLIISKEGDLPPSYRVNITTKKGTALPPLIPT